MTDTSKSADSGKKPIGKINSLGNTEYDSPDGKVTVALTKDGEVFIAVKEGNKFNLIQTKQGKVEVVTTPNIPGPTSEPLSMDMRGAIQAAKEGVVNSGDFEHAAKVAEDIARNVKTGRGPYYVRDLPHKDESNKQTSCTKAKATEHIEGTAYWNPDSNTTPSNAARLVTQTKSGYIIDSFAGGGFKTIETRGSDIYLNGSKMVSGNQEMVGSVFAAARAAIDCSNFTQAGDVATNIANNIMTGKGNPAAPRR